MGANAIVPYLSVQDAVGAIEFYKKAFGAVEIGPRLEAPDGAIAHDEMEINGGRFMLSEENKDWGNISPATLGGAGVTMHLEVPDVDAFAATAVAAGAEIVMPVADQFYGHRAGRLQDPYGHQWSISTVIEELSHDEMRKRMVKMFAEGKPGDGQGGS